MRTMDFDAVLKNLPHAYPFRVIDRLLEIEPGKRVVALKNVSINEPYFSGPFPKEPVMPPFLILEALAQTGGIAFHSFFEKEEGGIPFLARIDEFRMKKKVIPGDQLILEVEILLIFSKLAKVKVQAKVGGDLAAEGILVIALGQGSKESVD